MCFTPSCCNSEVHHSVYHLPDFFSPYQEIDSKNPEITLKEKKYSKEKILKAQLKYLSQSINGQSLEKPIHRKALLCGDHACGFFEEMVLNIDHIFTATCCFCFPGCTNPKPSAKTYITEETYVALNRSSEYLHRNTGLLCCLTPITVGAIPWVGLLGGFSCIPNIATAVATSFASSLTSIAGLSMAGCLTYFCSGDFGGVEREKELELTRGYDDLAKRIKKYRNREEWKEFIDDSSAKIAKNIPFIKKALVNRGIKERNAEMILGKLSKTVFEIYTDTLGNSQGQEEQEFQLKEIIIDI